jgi:hypothetical protein
MMTPATMLQSAHKMDVYQEERLWALQTDDLYQKPKILRCYGRNRRTGRWQEEHVEKGMPK